MASNSVGPVSVMLTADSTGITKGVDDGTKELKKLGAPVKIQNVDIDDRAMQRVDKRMTRKLEKAAILGTDPEIVKQVQLSALERVQGRTLKVAEAKERYGSIGGVSAQLGNIGAEFGELAATMAPLAVGLAVVGGVAYGMLQLGLMADPAKAEQYNQAWSDLMVAMGRVFIPVVELATDLIRAMADVALNLPNMIHNIIHAPLIAAGLEDELPTDQKSNGISDFLGKANFADIGGLGGQAQLAAMNTVMSDDDFKDVPDLMQEIVDLLKRQNIYTEDEVQQKANQQAKQGWYEM